MKQGLLILLFILLSSSGLNAQLNLQWQELGPDNVGGTIFGLVLDKRDPTRQTLYAGAYSGGIWKSTNGGDSWNYLGCADNYAVSCMTQASDGTIYFGTGSIAANEGSSFSFWHLGNGIYKLDPNDNVIHLPSTTATNNNSKWTRINRIAIHPFNPNYMIVATALGLYQSKDGGVIWDSIAVPGIPQVQGAIDVKWSRDSLIIFAAVGGNNKLIRSIDGGNSWSRVTNTQNPGFPSTQIGRIEIAIAPSNSRVIYLSIANGTSSYGSFYGAYKSTDGGNTWTSIGLGSGNFNPFKYQGWFDNALAVYPSNPDQILLGGVELYTWSSQFGWKWNAQFVDPNIDNTETVEKFLFVINDLNSEEIYVATSRGVFKSTTGVSLFPFPAFFSKNAGIRARDFYSVAASKSGRVMGGSFEYGTYLSNCQFQNFTRLNQDYAYCEFSHLDTNYYFTEGYSGKLHYSSNRGINFHSPFDTVIDPIGYGEPTRCNGGFNYNAPYYNPLLLHETKTAFNTKDSVTFIATHPYSVGDTLIVRSKTAETNFIYTTPLDLQAGDSLQVPDPVKSRLFLSSYCGIWMKKNALDSLVNPDWYKISDSTLRGTVTCYSVTKDGNTIYAGTSQGMVYKISGLNFANYNNYLMGDSFIITRSVATSRSIDGIAHDANNDSIVIVAVSGYSTQPNFYKSVDAGLHWIASQVGPLNTPAYACVIDANNSDNYIVGTEHGIWSSNDAGLTWHQDDQNICDIPVYRLRQIRLLEDNCLVLYAATNSRGLWRSFTLTPSGCNLNTCTYPSEAEHIDLPVSSLKIFPNPASTELSIAINLAHAQQLHISITDLLGRSILSEENFQLPGNQILHLDISSLHAGIYFVSTDLNGLRSSQLLVKSE